MSKITIKYPQIYFETKEIEVTEDEANDIMNGSQSQYIWDNLTENEQDWCPNRLKGLVDALDCDYASIKLLT